MNICLIGNGISTLLLANAIANRNVKVSLYGEDLPKKNYLLELWEYQKIILIFY